MISQNVYQKTNCFWKHVIMLAYKYTMLINKSILKYVKFYKNNVPTECDKPCSENITVLFAPDLCS